MPYTMKVDGLDEISKMLSEMENKAETVASKALYEGAGIMAEELNKSAERIKTAPFHYAVFVTREPSPEEKEIITNAGAGIAPFRNGGTEVETSVGYANSGYAMLKGKMKPIPQIVNAINSGTSFMKKQPFVRKAASTGGKKASKAMKEIIETEFEAMIKK